MDLAVVTVIVLLFITGLGNKPGYSDSGGTTHTLASYYVAAQTLGIITMVMFGSAMYQLVIMWSLDPDAGGLPGFERFLVVMTLGGPFAAALLHKRLLKLLKVFPQYLVCLPVFTLMVPMSGCGFLKRQSLLRWIWKGERR